MLGIPVSLVMWECRVVLWGYAEHDRHIAGDTHIPSEVSMGIHISLVILVGDTQKTGILISL